MQPSPKTSMVLDMVQSLMVTILLKVLSLLLKFCIFSCLDQPLGLVFFQGKLRSTATHNRTGLAAVPCQTLFVFKLHNN